MWHSLRQTLETIRYESKAMTLQNKWYFIHTTHSVPRLLRKPFGAVHTLTSRGCHCSKHFRQPVEIVYDGRHLSWRGEFLWKDVRTAWISEWLSCGRSSRSILCILGWRKPKALKSKTGLLAHRHRTLCPVIELDNSRRRNECSVTGGIQVLDR